MLVGNLVFDSYWKFHKEDALSDFDAFKHRLKPGLGTKTVSTNERSQKKVEADQSQVIKPTSSPNLIEHSPTVRSGMMLHSNLAFVERYVHLYQEINCVKPKC